MTKFDVSPIVEDIGESFTMSGVSKTYNDYGDPTETYTDYILSGVVQVIDGSEDELAEGLLQVGDIIVFVDENEPEAGNIKTDNYLTITETVSGIFRVVNVVKNEGHIEVHGKRIKDTTP